MIKDPYVNVDLPLFSKAEVCEEIPISKLILSEKNPRKITSEQMQKLQNSLENDPQFLYARPICVNMVDGKYYVYAGNQRVRAAKKLGWNKIKCHLSHNLSQEMIQSRMIKDNKTYGEFDYDALANEYHINDLLDFGFRIEELHGMVEEPGSKDKKKDKLIRCPNCNHEFVKNG